MNTSDKDLVERLKALDTCAISDTLDVLKLPGAVIGLLPLWAAPVICGQVITVQIGPKNDSQPSVHLNTPAIEVGGAGEVIVVANEGREDVSCWGDILSAAAMVKGIEGVVIDGACRDIGASARMGFPVYGRAVVPVSARGRIIQYGMNEPISIKDVTVSPGDFVLADESGTVFIPADQAEDIISRAERLVAKQEAMVAAVRSGRSVIDVMHDKEFDKVLKGGK